MYDIVDFLVKPRNAHENVLELRSIFVRLNKFPRESSVGKRPIVPSKGEYYEQHNKKNPSNNKVPQHDI